MTDNVEVKFKSDASEVKSGANIAGDAIKSLASLIMGLKDAFLVAGGAAVGSFREINAGAKEAAERVKGTAEAVTEFREAIAGVGEAIIAAFAVEQILRFFERIAEGAEQIKKVAITFGETTDQVMRMNAQFILLGVAPEAAARAMLRLDRAFSTAKEGSKHAEDAFNALGISTNEALTQGQLMERVLQGFSTLDGPARAAIAMQLFGRNVIEIAPILGLTKEQMVELNTEIDKSGAVNEDAERTGLAMAEAMNQNKLAMMGLGGTITQSLGPSIAGLISVVTDLVQVFVKSYREGGTARIVMEGLVVTFKLLASALVITGALFDEAMRFGIMLMEAMKTLGHELSDGLSMAIHEVVDSLSTLAAVMADIISGDWTAAVSHAKRGWQQMAQDFRATTRDMIEDGKEGGREIGHTFMDGVRDAVSGGKELEKIWQGVKLPELPKPAGGTTADLPEGKPKKGPSIVQVWEEELHRAEILSGDFFGDQAQRELDFWKEKVKLVGEGTKEWLEVQSKIYELSKQLAKQKRQEELEDARLSEQEKVNSENAKYQITKDGIEAQIEAVKNARARGDIGFDEEYAALRALHQRELDAQLEHENSIYAIKLAEKNRELELYATDPVNKQKVNKQIEVMERQHQDALTVITSKGVLDRQKLEDQAASESARVWQSRVSPIVQSWGDAMKGMLLGTMSWRQALGNVLTSILDEFIKFCEDMLIKWIAKELAQTTATTVGVTTRTGVEAAGHSTSIAMSAATAIADVANSAIRAAAGAYAAIAAIPIVGPILAPAAAAAALAAVIGIGKAIVSAEGGQDQVPVDGQMTQLHKNEMVLSAQYANPLRKMLSSAYFGNTGAAAALGSSTGGVTAEGSPSSSNGEVHLHVHAVDAKSVEQLFEKNGDALGRVLRRQARNLRLK